MNKEDSKPGTEERAEGGNAGAGPRGLTGLRHVTEFAALPQGSCTAYMRGGDLGPRPSG